MSRQVATFSTPYDADRDVPGGRRSAVKVIAIVVDGDTETGAPSIAYVVVDHDHRTALVPAGELTFTDASVQPPRYG